MDVTTYADEVIDESYELFYECDNDAYHVGDIFESRTICWITLCTTVLHSDGVTRNHYDTFDITSGFKSSYEGILLENPGEYIEILNGEDGLLRHPFYVYDYGDLNGDYKITMSDAIGLYRIIAGDPDYETDFIFNADMNNDDCIDLIDAVIIARKLNDLSTE
jgi:hypothetical protein